MTSFAASFEQTRPLFIPTLFPNHTDPSVSTDPPEAAHPSQWWRNCLASERPWIQFPAPRNNFTFFRKHSSRVLEQASTCRVFSLNTCRLERGVELAGC